MLWRKINPEKGLEVSELITVASYVSLASHLPQVEGLTVAQNALSDLAIILPELSTFSVPSPSGLLAAPWASESFLLVALPCLCSSPLFLQITIKLTPHLFLSLIVCHFLSNAFLVLHFGHLPYPRESNWMLPVGRHHRPSGITGFLSKAGLPVVGEPSLPLSVVGRVLSKGPTQGQHHGTLPGLCSSTDPTLGLISGNSHDGTCFCHTMA